MRWLSMPMDLFILFEILTSSADLTGLDQQS